MAAAEDREDVLTHLVGVGELAACPRRARVRVSSRDGAGLDVEARTACSCGDPMGGPV